MKEDGDERLRRIESHLTHLERQHDLLNEAVVAQGRELARIATQVRRLSQTIETLEMDRVKSTNPKPPHYQ